MSPKRLVLGSHESVGSVFKLDSHDVIEQVFGVGDTPALAHSRQSHARNAFQFLDVSLGHRNGRHHENVAAFTTCGD